MKRRRVVNAAGKRPGRRCVYGFHPVTEYLRAHPEAVAELWVAESRDAKRFSMFELAAAGGVKVLRTAAEKLTSVSGTAHHQGVVAVLREFGYASLATLLASDPALVVAADGIEDPRNLGALIRSVAAAGAGGVLIPQDRAVGVTPVVEKAAAGVTAWFPVCRVVNLARAITELKSAHGFWVIGLCQDGETSLWKAEVPTPTVLVVGGESGLRPLVRRVCHTTVRLPMAPRVESLNVAAATAVAAFELGRRHIDRVGVG